MDSIHLVPSSNLGSGKNNNQPLMTVNSINKLIKISNYL